MKPIALDAMGGDHAPQEIVLGAVAAAREGRAVALVGRAEAVVPHLKATGYRGDLISLIDAPEVGESHEPPLKAIRSKPQSSIAVGVGLVKDGAAAAFVSAGSTGAVVATALLLLGKMEGVDRPALGILYGTRNGTALLLDVGANADCRPEFLAQFAHLGNLYMERVLGRARPRIGLLNNGEEEGKGNQLTRNSYALLKESPLNFVGNVEAKDIFLGVADVVVTDGFTGNMVLKANEGFGENLFWHLSNTLQSGLHLRLLGLLLRPTLGTFKRKVDYSEYGGAPLLGV
ncbi:MAG: phosphate acyltransferase PlsX, partial [Chloroflexota bacterium]